MSEHATKDHQGSMLGQLLTVPVIGMSAYLLVAAGPYLIDADCSRSGYSPVSVTSCLPDTEIANTNWAASVPIHGVSHTINRDQPLIQVLPPAILKLTIYGSGVIAGLVLLSALFRNWGTPSSQPVAVKVAEPWEETHSLSKTHRD